MRQLVVTRGAMGVGKTTWLEQNDLTKYTISPDQIRLMVQSPILNEQGGLSISQKNENRVWELLYAMLEDRMKRGEFTIIDATHSKISDFTKYKELCQKYRYRIACVDFSDVPITVAKMQNRSRESYKFVPEDRIDMVYERLAGQPIPNFVKVVKPQEFWSEMDYLPRDFSEYKKIHHFGDIHGCYDALMEYFRETYHSFNLDTSYPSLNHDELYIFVGDLLDRGIQNVEVLKFFISIKDEPNVIILEGNHEKHLWNWAQDNVDALPKHFIHYTKPILDKAEINGEIDRKDVRQLYRKLNQICFYEYHSDKTVLVTHGGISAIPDNLLFVATDQFVNGVGKYETEIDEIFLANTAQGFYQIHGHRNIQRNPVQVNDRCFNLEGRIEYGGHLRVITLDMTNGFETIEIKNDVYNTKFDTLENTIKDVTFSKMAGDRYVDIKNVGEGIVSFNFNKEAFKRSKWNENTIQARGLFFNVETEEIVARSYNKFFNVNERPETRIDRLADKLSYPVKVYLKENGYLGLIGYNSQKDELVFTSKSTTDSAHAGWLKDLFYKSLADKYGFIDKINEIEKQIKEYLKDENATFVFEVIDPINDPHIIGYSFPRLVLLDIVHRSTEYSKKKYDHVLLMANLMNVYSKQLDRTINSWNEFYTWYKEVTEDWGLQFEGYVIEDQKGFMTKIKLPYYTFWKSMRGVRDILVSKNPVFNKGSLYNKLGNQFYNWMIKKDKEYLRASSIIGLRKHFEVDQQDFIDAT